MPARPPTCCDGVRVRVVSMPCMDTFTSSDEAYQEQVLPAACRARVAVEAASPLGWDRWIGRDGMLRRHDELRRSGPAAEVYEQFGITAQAVADSRPCGGRTSRGDDDERHCRPTSTPTCCALAEAGTSPWLDQIRRSLIERGELARMVAEDSLQGRDLQPVDLREGDPRLRGLRRGARGDGARGARARRRSTSASRSSDVQLACRRPAPGVGETNGARRLRLARGRAGHGPRRAEVARGARDFWKRVNRPNVMIKIPGTPEGAGAIEQAIYEGINVNVTLLFAVEAYERVAEAYIRGLERRQAEDKPLKVASVASFFVSRIDTAVDKQLKALGHDELPARRRSPTPRAPTRASSGSSPGARWEALRHAGASRPAPAVGLDRGQEPRLPRHDVRRRARRARTPSTRCRMTTLLAVADHGNVSGPTAKHNPQADLDALADAGIDLGRDHRPAADRRRPAVRGRDEPAAGRDRGAAPGDHHRPPAGDPGAGCPRSSPTPSPRASRAPPSRTSPGASGARTSRCGAATA